MVGVGVLAILAVAALVVALALGLMALNQIKQLRRELDETQRQLNELQNASVVVPTPPPLPRTRSAGLDDLRQQLRRSHREAEESASPE